VAEEQYVGVVGHAYHEIRVRLEHSDVCFDCRVVLADLSTADLVFLVPCALGL